MSLTIELDAILEAQVTQEARRLGRSEADFVKDTLERALGMRNPAELLDQVCSYTPMGDSHLSENTGEKFKAILRERHAQSQASGPSSGKALDEPARQAQALGMGF